MLRLAVHVALLSIAAVPSSGGWLMTCAKQSLAEWKDQVPIEGSTGEALVSCMVDHVMSSPYSLEQLLLIPMDKDWCLPSNFLAASQSCEGVVNFDPYEPIRHCVEKEGYPTVSQEYAGDFQSVVNSTGESKFYYTSRFVFAMCAYLDALGSDAGEDCLLEVCAQASHSPSQAPSRLPSVTPSVLPSSQPSFGPSGPPTLEPSMRPSLLPSQRPTSYPTSTPSLKPTNAPSATPTAPPTIKTDSPSQIPSLTPSSYPTAQPRKSQGSLVDSLPVLHIQVTLRVLLDDVEFLEDPLSVETLDVLEIALIASFQKLSEVEGLEIVSENRALIPEHAPIVLTFRVYGVHPCDNKNIECSTSMNAASEGNAIARMYRDVFEEAVQSGFFVRAIHQQAKENDITGLLMISSRPQSSNLISSNSFVVEAKVEATSSGFSVWSATPFHACVYLVVVLHAMA